MIQAIQKLGRTTAIEMRENNRRRIDKQLGQIFAERRRLEVLKRNSPGDLLTPSGDELLSTNC
jgi:hypothetical protein